VNQPGPPAVDVRSLYVTFTGRGLRRGQDAHAVDGVDLQVMPGEIVALAGESGCGKTTLARTILGLEKPIAGEIAYQGSPLRYSSRALKAYRRNVQLVLQDPTGALNPRQSVYEAVAEGIRIHKLRGNEGSSLGHCRGRGCGLQDGSSCATRTSCPVGSGSGSSSLAPWRSIRR
jgi:ABC-type glutathione transport system ATPase component